MRVMKKKMFLGLLVILCGLVLTIGSVAFSRKAAFDNPCRGPELKQVKRGFPLPYLHIEPSESICQSVESLSILVKGNAFHEQYPSGFVIDFVYWSGLSAMVGLVAMYVRERNK